MTDADRLDCVRRHYLAHAFYLALVVAVHGWPALALDQLVIALPCGGSGVLA